MRRKARRQVRRFAGGGAALVVLACAWWLWPEGESEALAQSDAAPAEVEAAPRERVPVIVMGEGLEPAGPADPAANDEPLTPAMGGGSMLASDQVVASESDAPEDDVRADIATSGDLVSEGEDAGSDDGSGASPLMALEPAPVEPIAPEPAAAPANPLNEQLSADPRVDAALKRYVAGDRIAARTELNRMLQTATQRDLNNELRRHLARIADETIFAREIISGDPLAADHRLADGQYLAHLEKLYEVPYEMVMRINGITDARRIQAGQRMKAPRGPFHAVIHKSQFRLDLYLQDLYLRSFPVGLGADSSTPTGDWIVKECLPNPTYYPPASAKDRRIIKPNDPRNPLGEFWVGLEGVSGEALGQKGFGIHGTIEPESIGKNASMGCVRMLDDDIAFVYAALLERKSKVKIVP